MSLPFWPSRTIGARPVRTTRFQLVPPLVDRSSVPGESQSPTVARQAVFSDTANIKRCAGDGSTTGAEGVDSEEALDSGELRGLIDAGGGGVSLAEGIGSGELTVSVGCASSVRSGLKSSRRSTTLTKISPTRTTLDNNLVVRRTA